jgi:hypothetical protein
MLGRKFVDVATKKSRPILEGNSTRNTMVKSDSEETKSLGVKMEVEGENGENGENEAPPCGIESVLGLEIERAF